MGGVPTHPEEKACLAFRFLIIRLASAWRGGQAHKKEERPNMADQAEKVLTRSEVQTQHDAMSEKDRIASLNQLQENAVRLINELDKVVRPPAEQSAKSR